MLPWWPIQQLFATHAAQTDADLKSSNDDRSTLKGIFASLVTCDQKKAHE